MYAWLPGRRRHLRDRGKPAILSVVSRSQWTSLLRSSLQNHRQTGKLLSLELLRVWYILDWRGCYVRVDIDIGHLISPLSAGKHYIKYGFSSVRYFFPLVMALVNLVNLYRWWWRHLCWLVWRCRVTSAAVPATSSVRRLYGGLLTVARESVAKTWVLRTPRWVTAWNGLASRRETPGTLWDVAGFTASTLRHTSMGAIPTGTYNTTNMAPKRSTRVHTSCVQEALTTLSVCLSVNKSLLS